MFQSPSQRDTGNVFAVKKHEENPDDSENGSALRGWWLKMSGSVLYTLTVILGILGLAVGFWIGWSVFPSSPAPISSFILFTALGAACGAALGAGIWFALESLIV